MLKKVLLLSISLGTISNSISMDNVIYRYNIPISITMGTLVGLGSRLYTNNIKYNIGIGLGIGIGTYFISKLFGSNDEHVNTENNLNPINQGPDQPQNDITNIDMINQEQLQKELNSPGCIGKNKNYSGIYNEIINNRFDNSNQKHMDFFWESIKQGNLNIFKCLISKGAAINAKDNNGDTPLHHALIHNEKKIVQLLLSKEGINVNAKNSNGNTTLHIASSKGHLSVVEYLISKGADINAKNKSNETPLYWASYYGYLPIVEYLINNEADINAKDNEGNTPLDIAEEEIKDLLIRHRAKTKAELAKESEIN